jgi:hypothetical protein
MYMTLVRRLEPLSRRKYSFVYSIYFRPSRSRGERFAIISLAIFTLQAGPMQVSGSFKFRMTSGVHSASVV